METYDVDPPPLVDSFMDGFVATKEAADAAETQANVCKASTCFIQVLPPTGHTIGKWSKNGPRGGLQDVVKKWSKHGFGPLRRRAQKVVQKWSKNGLKMVAGEGRTI